MLLSSLKTVVIPPRRSQSGMTLIEVLIAVLVLSVGLLGLAAMQTVSLRQNQSAAVRSQATLLAYEITDRMRANRQGALDGDYNLAIDAATPAPTDIPTTDLAEWRNELDLRLPAGTGSVAVDANDMATIVVQWDDSRGADAPITFQYMTRL